VSGVRHRRTVADSYTHWGSVGVFVKVTASSPWIRPKLDEINPKKNPIKTSLICLGLYGTNLAPSAGKRSICVFLNLVRSRLLV
jgi:hypothetical protein